MSFNYRCTRESCRARRTLRKRKEQYVRKPKCLCCGGRLSFDPEPRRRHARDTCWCDGTHYPHRKGSVVFCKHHPTGPTEEDWQALYGPNY